MTYSDSAERAAFIGGLRGLADYLESNPGQGRFEGTDAV
jgi:hypothetical protein